MLVGCVLIVCAVAGCAQTDDQGLVNTDPRTIAVPNGWVNMIPTDVRGLTFDRTPQQLLNILFLGNPAAKGVFFPNGVMGAINKPAGYNLTASGLDSFPSSGAKVATQVWPGAFFIQPYTTAFLMVSVNQHTLLQVKTSGISCSTCVVLPEAIAACAAWRNHG